MKLPITDQFLWDVYTIISKVGDILDLVANPRAAYSYSPCFSNPIFKKYKHDKNNKKFARLIYYLKTNNYIKVENLKGKKAIILTKEGLDKALKASFIMEERKKRKDGKWIMLTFDIPEKHRKARDLLRSVLCNLGYKMFQQSVWITPYDIFDKTESALQFYSLDRYVKIFLIEEI